MLLIRFLIISICVLYILRSIVRMVLPALFRGVVNKAQQNAQQNQYRHQQPPRPTGKIKVEYMPPGKKTNIPDSEGDFVEYEEVK